MALKAKFKTLSWTDFAETATPAVKKLEPSFSSRRETGFPCPV